MDADTLPSGLEDIGDGNGEGYEVWSVGGSAEEMPPYDVTWNKDEAILSAFDAVEEHPEGVVHVRSPSEHYIIAAGKEPGTACIAIGRAGIDY